MNQETTNTEMRCEHCRRSFIRESSFVKHMCEPKNRWLDRDRAPNRIAYNSWLQFTKKAQPNRRTTEYSDFSKSPYYTAFLKFANYCIDSKVFNVERYLDWLIRNKVPVDRWPMDAKYDKFLKEFVKLENVHDAITRSIRVLQELSDRENIKLSDVFTYCSTNRLIHLVSMNKLSPWLLYQSDRASEWLSNLSEEHVNLIFETIEPQIWSIKFKRDPATVKLARDMCQEAGL